MTRGQSLTFAGFVTLAALLLANLLSPSRPHAFGLPEAGGPAVAVSAAGDSAWVVVGTKVYYVTLKTRGEITNRTITVIDDEELK